MKIKFLGAVMSVTGSCHLVTTDKYKFLLDCGLFQGSEVLKELNFEPFDFKPSEIDFVILSHAHVDHCGRIPLLVKHGFKGKIYCTGATAEIADIMLKDSGNIHEMDALWQNKRSKRSARPPIMPLYTEADADACADYFYPVAYGTVFQINPQVSIRFNEAGHILGAAITEIWIKEEEETVKIVYSGDIGIPNQRMLNDPTLIDQADYLIMETTYGDRTHETHEESTKRLMEIISKTIARGGTIVIPSFALGRTQDLIHELELRYEAQDVNHHELNQLQVYVDSPLATDATAIFRRNAHYFNQATREHLKKGDELLCFKNLHFTKSIDQSKALNDDQSPKIIIASSGMADAGRVQHHLKHYLWKPKSSIIFVGYQAEGTTGREIINGAQYVRILNERISVAAEIYFLEGFSAHADKNYLLTWLAGFKEPPKKIFLVHGEEESKKTFAQSVKNRLGYDCTVIEDVSEYCLDDEGELSCDNVKPQVDAKKQLNKIKNSLEDLHDDLAGLLTGAGFKIRELYPEEKINDIAALSKELEENCEKLRVLIGDTEGK
jgi:metallo-beta-lactamase family protein